uniref:Pleckstrin homology domain containing S1, tandem duplicate 2 n=1 Tax=Gasterosteus aculeatus aculeatus TaxID=481459 RepID=A0AAQ4S964_GASAC|nr:pleckstrin homology domain-containing family S member 1-like isoform X2 [Gasterosteus aculeatus aculeatus]
MIKSQKNTVNKGGTVFYRPVKNTAEVRSGYLFKSPPQKLVKTQKWKRRYFVLFKIDEQEHLLKYFKSPEEKDSPLGAIDLSQISLLYKNPAKHGRWPWVEKVLKCSASCVFLIKAAEREYFLAADNSEEADGWFADLYEALKARPHQRMSSEVISYPILRIKTSAAAHPEVEQKTRSKSDPLSNTLETNSKEPKAEDHSKRRVSEPVYDYPKTFKTKTRAGNLTIRRKSFDAIYETMSGIIAEQAACESDCESEDCEVKAGSLMRSVTNAFEKMRTPVPPLPSFNEETADEDRKERRSTSDFSSSSSDNGAVSPAEMLEDLNRKERVRSAEREKDFRHRIADLKTQLTEVERNTRKERRLTPYFSSKSLEEKLEGQNGQTRERSGSIESIDITPREIDFQVTLADLKKYLILTEVDGKPSVSGWTCQPQPVCLFHREDRILAINDLLTTSLQEFNMYLSKCLKNEVKLTTLRLPGSQPLHSPDCPCSD